MKTILITGGTDGLGEGVAMDQLKNGNRVIIVGSSSVKGNAFCNEAKNLGLSERIFFIQADLSLIKENHRIIEEINRIFPVLDAIIFCAAKHNKKYIETEDGFEFTFALAYLSRFIIGYGLKECLEKSEAPVIMNICGTGMNGKVNWNDLQHKNSFNPLKVMMHGSRLNDLLGVEYIKNDTVGKIKYILYNPMAVKTPGMMGYNLFIKLIFILTAKPIEKAVLPIAELLDNPPTNQLTSFKEGREINLTKDTFDKDNAQRLYTITKQLISNVN